jgi:hypothetical protein
MSVAIYTVELALSLWDEDNGRWGPYTDPKNMISVQIEKPEPTTIKNVSARPDDTFAQTTDSFLISTGSPRLTMSTRDIVNRESTPIEMSMLAAALAAKMATLTKAAATSHYFTSPVDALEMNIDVGDRNLAAGTSDVYKRVTAGGTGTATSATVTTLVDSGKAWTPDALIGDAVMITAGTGAGQVVEITDNDATSLTVAAWGTQPDATSQYAVVELTPFVEDSDYTVDPVYGTIKPLSTGNIVVGDVLHGLVDSFAITGDRFRGATKDAVTFRARGKAKDIKNGNAGFLTIHRVVAYSSAAQEFVANAENPEFKTLELSGELETPSGYTEPYTFDDNLAYAAS